jgi:hypothetical protein
LALLVVAKNSSDEEVVMIFRSTVVAVILFLGSLGVAQAFNNGGVAAPGEVLGWNYGHVANCAVGTDGTNSWFVVQVQEGGYGYTNDPTLIAMAAPACQTGNLFAVHVTRINPLAWDQVVVFPFK